MFGSKIFGVVSVVSDSATLLFISAVIGYKLLRQETTWFIWMQICALWLAYACFLARDSLILADETAYVDQISFINTASSFFYLAQHWVFALSYLQIAIIFKLSFSYNDRRVKTELARRTTIIRILTIIVIIILLLPDILIVIFTIGNTIGMLWYTMFCSLISFYAITGILTVSIFRIRKYSRMLVQNGVFSNERLMYAHLSSFALISVMQTFSTPIFIHLYGINEADFTTQEERLRLTETICNFGTLFGGCGVVYTMCLMFVKHSKTLTEE